MTRRRHAVPGQGSAGKLGAGAVAVGLVAGAAVLWRRREQGHRSSPAGSPPHRAPKPMG